jgi:hypothetical protein
MKVQIINNELLKFTHNFFAERIQDPYIIEVLGKEVWVDGEGYFSNDPSVGCVHRYPQLKGNRVWLNSIDNSNNDQNIYAYGLDGITIISAKVFGLPPVVYAIEGEVQNVKEVEEWLKYIHHPYFVPDTKVGVETAMEISGMEIPEVVFRSSCVCSQTTEKGARRLKSFFPEKNICISSGSYGKPPVPVQM